MTALTTRRGELSLHDMLADPIVQTMMNRDGVKRQEVETLFAALREGGFAPDRRPELSPARFG